MKKALTLIEVLLAITLFSFVSLSLYALLHTGISIRKKVDLEHSRRYLIYINLEKIAKEIRSVVAFEDGISILKADKENLEFYALVFDYFLDGPCLIEVSYSFKENELIRTVKNPLNQEVLTSFSLIKNIEEGSFYYFNDQKEDGINNPWQESWDGIELPAGVKIKIVYKDFSERRQEFSKLIEIYR